MVGSYGRQPSRLVRAESLTISSSRTYYYKYGPWWVIFWESSYLRARVYSRDNHQGVRGGFPFDFIPQSVHGLALGKILTESRSYLLECAQGNGKAIAIER